MLLSSTCITTKSALLPVFSLLSVSGQQHWSHTCLTPLFQNTHLITSKFCWLNLQCNPESNHLTQSLFKQESISVLGPSLQTYTWSLYNLPTNLSTNSRWSFKMQFISCHSAIRNSRMIQLNINPKVLAWSARSYVNQSLPPGSTLSLCDCPLLLCNRASVLCLEHANSLLLRAFDLLLAVPRVFFSSHVHGLLPHGIPISVLISPTKRLSMTILYKTRPPHSIGVPLSPTASTSFSLFIICFLTEENWYQ